MALFGLGINGNIFLQMAFEPAAVVEGFANGDTIEPSLQRTTLPKPANAAEGFQEDFLGSVGGVGNISEHAENKVVNGAMVVRDQPVEGRFRAGLQLDDEFTFIAAPREGASPTEQGRPSPRHVGL